MFDDERGNRIETKIDKIVDHIGEINVTLGKQHVSLDEHIRRTAILEQKIGPLERDQAMAHGIIKAFLWAFAAGSLIGGISELLTFLRK